LAIFGEKIGVFSKTNVMIKFLRNFASFFEPKIPFLLIKMANKYFKNHKIGVPAGC
jgi:hypothetical protein